MQIFEIPDEILASNHLQSLGFKVEIMTPSSSEKSCDLVVNDHNDNYLIEVKRRQMDDKEKEEMDRQELYQHPSRSLGFDKRLEDKIDYAIKQLRVTSSTTSTKYFLVWISIIDRYDEVNIANYERILSTVYGMKRILFNHEDGTHSTRGCYYFLNSAFYKYKDLDAVIIAHNKDCELFVNNFSLNYKHFLQSKLYQSFGESIRDPNILQEPDEDYFIADCDIDRKDTLKVSEYLAKKYSIRNVQSFDLMSHDMTATVRIR